MNTHWKNLVTNTIFLFAVLLCNVAVDGSIPVELVHGKHRNKKIIHTTSEYKITMEDNYE